MDLDRTSPYPLYYQLKQILLEKIEQGEWKPGSRIPTEFALQESTKLSRTTIRQALQELENEGYINRHPGMGTFVSERKFLSGPNPYDMEMTFFNPQKLNTSWKLLKAEFVPATITVASRLNIEPGERVFHISRLRIIENIVISHSNVYLRQDYVDLVDQSRLTQGGSMYYLSHLDITNYTTEHFIEVSKPDKESIRLLNIDKDIPLMINNRILRNDLNEPFEFFQGFYRGDKFSYHIQPMPLQI